MINEYTVRYYLGNKKNVIYQLFVSAHDREEADKIVVAQAHRRHGTRGKVTVYNEPGIEFIPTYVSEISAPVVTPSPKKPFNWNGCVSTSVFALCAYIVATAFICATPCWLIYILIKYLGG